MNFEKLFIDGKWQAPSSTQMIEVLDVSDKSVMARVPAGNKEDVDKAVTAAKNAQKAWQKTPIRERVQITKKMLDYLKGLEEVLLDLEIRELGQPTEWTKNTHILRNWARIESYLEIAETFEFVRGNEKSKLIYEPIGVVGCLTPWNYPLGQVVQKIIPAILGGNSVVLKPSQHTPLTVYYMAEGFRQAGLPEGVFNIVTGAGKEVGQYLTTHPDIDMISFTGSTLAGRIVGQESLSTIKKFSLELGGKSPALCLPDCDYDKYLPLVAASCFSNSGQTCAAYTRLVIPKKDYDVVVTKMRALADTWVAGLPFEKEAKLGPVINHQAFLKVKTYIENGLKDGAELLYGTIPVDDGKDIVSPVIFGKVRSDMAIVKEEIFGPVLVIQTYDSLEEGIEIANDTTYGLVASVFGEASLAKEVALELKAGQIYTNLGVRDINAPFGGYKESGIGREGGPIGFEEFLEVKAIFID